MLPAARSARIHRGERRFMKIGIETVRHVARLANLDFSDQELELFTRQLDSILGYIDKLNELETTRIEPTSHVTRIEQTLREDRAAESLSVSQALANAPESKDHHFTVPKVIS
jgi:aspartyl-tRNA(Asn)/glutamyl-tRNA(Gln) amidotransferase subunit C